MKNPLASLPEPAQLAIAVIGGIVGAVLGYFIFQFVFRAGLYGISLVGLTVGYGMKFAYPRGSWFLAVTAIVLTLAGMIVAEAWRYLYTDLPGIVKFATQVLPNFGSRDLTVKLVCYLVGAVVAFCINMPRFNAAAAK